MREAGGYRYLERLLAEQRPILLDGGVATELGRRPQARERLSDHGLWGTWALYDSPQEVLEIHRRYLEAGADVVSTNTWAILSAPDMETRLMLTTRAGHWMDVARTGLRLARRAVQETGSQARSAVAFSINGDIHSAGQLDTLELLTRIFAEEQPDLVLMETLSLIRDPLTFQAVELMLKTGLPVWLSFRRCRYGVCGLHGQHWGGPEGDLFGRTARRFEKMGVQALLINCLPVDHVTGMLPWLRDFTDMPLGVYPNLGRYLDPGWKFDECVGPAQYAELAARWRQEGAQIVGGCCGVRPEHIQAVRCDLDTSTFVVKQPPSLPPVVRTPPQTAGWSDALDRSLYPLPFPQIVCEKGVFRPTEGSLLVWKHLFAAQVGRGGRCLDVGCGTGILAVQLALNGATRVDAVDIEPEAVANTLSNAFRNGVSDRVQGRVVDLYSFLPEDRYDVVVASLYQMPVDPYKEPAGHRPLDFWGRNLIDHLISLLPELLAENGKAYLMQISLLGELRTRELLAQSGLHGRAIDFGFFRFSRIFHENIEQIRRVEELSDAYHLTWDEEHWMTTYLLEISRP